jgi:8-oxo-dGTP diphosphatase
MSKPHIRVVIAEIERHGRFLITQRRENAVMPMLWEFPGGRVQPGESDQQALARSLRERLGVELAIEELTLQTEHAYDEYVVVLASYRAAIIGEPSNQTVNDHRWVAPEEFDQYPFPDADQSTVDALLRGPL